MRVLKILRIESQKLCDSKISIAKVSNNLHAKGGFTVKSYSEIKPKFISFQSTIPNPCKNNINHKNLIISYFERK